MKRHRFAVLGHVAALAAALLAPSGASAAEFALRWQGLGAQAVQEIDLAVGDEAVIEVWFTLNDGDTLSGLGFDNELLANVVQVATAANAAIGWTDQSVDGASLGDGQQWVALFGTKDFILDAPGAYLLGTQTIQLTGAGDGGDIEIVARTVNLVPLDMTGAVYTLVATGSANQDAVGFFHITTGSPGYLKGRITDVRDPLIIHVAASGGGGGGGGGGTVDDNTNDNANVNDNVDTNGGADPNDNGTVDDNTNDNGSTTNDNVNDNANVNGNDNTADPNDNGAVDPNDNSGGNVNDNGSADNANDNGATSNPPRGFCGLGIVGMLPASLFGLLAMSAARRRRTC